jgi:hypothetical protein
MLCILGHFFIIWIVSWKQNYTTEKKSEFKLLYIMYLYGFTTFAGIDKVMKVDRDDLWFSAGDLLQSDDEYFLVLGDEVSFTEQYTSRFPEGRDLQLIYSRFVWKKYIARIHWMVAQYYSTYRNVMKYFVSQDIESLLKKEVRKKPNWLKKTQLEPRFFGVPSLAEKGQTLIVYPDLWTMTYDGWWVCEKSSWGFVVAFLRYPGEEG